MNDRIFLVKLGVESKGIIASGFVAISPFYDGGDKTRIGNRELIIGIDFDVLLNSNKESILPQSYFLCI